jgi:ribose/xylose/arabinose/galactoside ABC-type transport system permease subunit
MSVDIEKERKMKAMRSWFEKITKRDDFMIVVMFFVFILIWLSINPGLRSVKSIMDLLRETSPYILSVIGVGLLMIGGEFDLSIGSLIALVNVVTVSTFKYTGNIWMCIISGLLIGIIIGAINAFWVNKLGLNSLVATLAMMFLLRGVVYIYTGRKSVITEISWPSGIKSLYYGSFASIPIPFIISIAALAVFYFIMARTSFGRNVYAIGGNNEASIALGINVKKTKMILFILSSFLTSVSALIITGQTLSGYFDLGSQGWEVTVISACVLGGIFLSGGRGTIIGAVLGMLIINITTKGLRLFGVYTTWMLVVNGLILIFALYAYRIRDALLKKE